MNTQLNTGTLHVDLDESRGHGEEKAKPFTLLPGLFLTQLDLKVWLRALWWEREGGKKEGKEREEREKKLTVQIHDFQL